MNFNQNATIGYDSALMESVLRIMNNQLIQYFMFHSPVGVHSFIKIKERDEKFKDNAISYPLSSIYHLYSNSYDNCSSNHISTLSSYCLCTETKAVDTSAQILTNDGEFDVQNFETYKQLKKVAKESDPNISKEEIYEKLLEPFRHEKIKTWDQALGRFKISYICKYDECNKEFTKTWNLLDHVRMHEGIKPFVCKICDKTFTQKGNLKKHDIIQHSTKSLKERKKFKCKLCSKRYTERYNLVVKFHI